MNLHFQWSELGLEGLEQVAGFEYLCFPSNPASSPSGWVEYYHRELGVFLEIGQGVGRCYLSKCDVLVIQYTKRTFWGDVWFTILGGCGYESGLNCGDGPLGFFG